MGPGGLSPAAAALATMRQVGLPSRSDMAEPGGGGGGRLLMRPGRACAGGRRRGNGREGSGHGRPAAPFKPSRPPPPHPAVDAPCISPRSQRRVGFSASSHRVLCGSWAFRASFIPPSQ